MDQPIALGYSSAGTVIEVGEGVKGFSVGDRVVSNGPHAHIVSVPQNLCAKIPEKVGFEEAAFAVLGSIALQGVRLAQPTLGETFAVTALGLIGLLTVQLLRQNGCRVLGIDLEPHRLELARQFGAEVVDITNGTDVVSAAQAYTGGCGVDGVLLTATTKSSQPVRSRPITGFTMTSSAAAALSAKDVISSSCCAISPVRESWKPSPFNWGPVMGRPDFPIE